MKTIFTFLILFTTLTVFAATKYLQGDSIKSLDLSKTYTFPGTQGKLITGEAVSGDVTAVTSGDYTNFQITTGTIVSTDLANSGVTAGTYKGGVTVNAKGLVTSATASLDLTNGVTGTLPVANGGTGLTSLGASQDMTLLTSSDTTKAYWAFPKTSKAIAIRSASLTTSASTTKIAASSDNSVGSISYSNTNDRFQVTQSGYATIFVQAECEIADGTVEFGVKVNGGSFMSAAFCAGQSGASTNYLGCAGVVGANLNSGDYIEIFYSTALVRTCRDVRAEVRY